MMRLFVSFMIAFVLMMTILINKELITKAWSADLKVPKPKLYVEPLPKTAPIQQPLTEQCVPDDGLMHGSSNQVAIADVTCPSGQRWRNK
jgi:hypothetical protein